MRRTKVTEKHMSFIGYQNVALSRGFVKSNVWHKDKYTHTFDISMNNRAIFKCVKVMQSVCYSKDLNDMVRMGTNARHSCHIPMDEDGWQGLAHNQMHLYLRHTCSTTSKAGPLHPFRQGHQGGRVCWYKSAPSRWRGQYERILVPKLMQNGPGTNQYEEQLYYVNCYTWVAM